MRCSSTRRLSLWPFFQQSASARSSSGLRGSRCLPMKSLLVRWGAVAPPCVRTGYTMSFFSRLASHLVANQRHLTNLGIHPYLRCELPLHNSLLQFGSPKLYAGEQSSLELVEILARDSKAFIDVGAHLGYYTFFVATRAQHPPVIHFLSRIRRCLGKPRETW